MRSWIYMSIAITAIVAMVLPFGSVTATPGIEMTNDELAALVKEAYIYSFPVYEMYRTRYNAVYNQNNPARTDLNHFVHRRHLADYTDRSVTQPNNDTLYSSAWLDLSLEPIILSVPDTNGRYYVMPFMDFYTNVFDYVGMRTTGTGAGSYVIVGPEWSEETPAGLPVISSPTNSVWLIGRTLVESEEDLPNVHTIQDQYQLTPLSVWEETGEAKVKTDLDNPPPAPDPTDPWNFFQIVNIGMTENPPPSDEASLMSEFAKIGVGPGQTFDPDRFTEEQKEIVLTAMRQARQRDIYRAMSSITVREGFTYLPLNMGNYGKDYYLRAFIALVGLGALEPVEAVYFGSETDKDGNPYDARNCYLLRFKKEDLPPVNAFWSLSLYEVAPDGRRYFTENPINRYSIGDRTEGLKYNSDGSLEIYIQRRPPSEDKVSNWLPAPSSSDAFTLNLRCYLPGEPIVNGQYRVPGVEQIPCLCNLKDKIVNLQASDFNNKHAWAGQQQALLNKVDAVIQQIEAGAYQGAIDKLRDDVEKHIEEWIVGEKHPELIEEVNAAIAMLVRTLLTVQTQYGKVSGIEAEGNTWVWKGIPYAQPPVDELRWKAPQDHEPWDGVLEAAEEPERCLQPATAQTWHPLGYNHGSEDCLYLNIWRPQTEETGLPVYFWIHGGSNNFGGCADYNGSVIASRSNMVVVVVQYRLGPFGWFNHPALQHGDPEDDSGNFGTLDCIKALQWVRDNIAAFGGDPDNVTVAGESAGAHNTMSLVISPLASGLFHRAVSESGGMQIVSVEHGIEMANATIDNLLVADGTCATLEEAAAYRAGMSDAEIEAYLRAKPGEDILNAQLVGQEETHNAYADGYVIPGGFVETIESGDYNQVPIVLGSNEYEMKDFIPLFAPLLGKTSWAYVYDLFDPDFDPTHEWTMGEIFPTAADSIIYEACGYYGALNWKAHYVDEIARPLQEQQDDVYAYLFQWGGPGSGPEPFDFVFGAAHAMEIPFFWGADESLFGYSWNEENRPGREELQDDMMAYMANFAATGDPNGYGLYEWEEWSNDEGGPRCIQFNATYTEADISMMNWEITPAGVAAEVATLPVWVQPYVWAFIW